MTKLTPAHKKELAHDRREIKKIDDRAQLEHDQRMTMERWLRDTEAGQDAGARRLEWHRAREALYKLMYAVPDHVANEAAQAAAKAAQLKVLHQFCVRQKAGAVRTAALDTYRTTSVVGEPELLAAWQEAQSEADRLTEEAYELQARRDEAKARHDELGQNPPSCVPVGDAAYDSATAALEACCARIMQARQALARKRAGFMGHDPDAAAKRVCAGEADEED